MLEHCPIPAGLWPGLWGAVCIAAEICVGLGFEAPELKEGGDDLCNGREVRLGSIVIRLTTNPVRRGGLPTISDTVNLLSH